MTPLAFSPDGAMLAICRQAQAVQLLDPASGREFATLTPPDLQIFSWLAFSPDSSQLAAATEDHVIHLWDLRLLRQELAALHLDWDLAPISPPQNPGNSHPLQAHIDRGTLIWESSPNDPDRLRQEVGIYSIVLSLNPFNFQAYRKRGEAHRRQGEYAKALDDLSMALILTTPDNQPRLDPDLAKACNELAWEWATGRFHLFDPRQILVLAQKAVELAPNQWMSRNTLGVVYYRLGRYSEAQDSLQQSLRDSKGEAPAFDLFFLAMCHHRLRNPAKARDCYDRAVLWVRDHENKLPEPWKKELNAFRTEAEELLVLNSPQSGPVR
jgi:tetratricopeptide (TPR) repeat protein